MPKKPLDRLEQILASLDQSGDIDPKIYMVVDGGRFLRPGLETYFAEPSKGDSRLSKNGCSCHPETGVC